MKYRKSAPLKGRALLFHLVSSGMLLVSRWLLGRIPVDDVPARGSVPQASRLVGALEAAQLYVRRHRLSKVIAGVEARTEADPSLLKPNPHLLLNALNARGRSGSDSLMIGDATFHVEAARHVGIPVIALANDPAKRDGLLRAQPDAMISEVTELIGT